MATTMHRLQISLPHAQMRFLEARARLDGVSLAEEIRRILAAMAGAEEQRSPARSLWDIAGIAEDSSPLIAGAPVSERVALYLNALAAIRPAPVGRDAGPKARRRRRASRAR